MGEFDDYLKENNITHKIITRYLPEQNGKSERVNRTIMDLIWAIFTQQKLFQSLQTQIIKIVVYLQNQSLINKDITMA